MERDKSLNPDISDQFSWCALFDLFCSCVFVYACVFVCVCLYVYVCFPSYIASYSHGKYGKRPILMVNTNEFPCRFKANHNM